MPTALAIRCKSGLAPASALRAWSLSRLKHRGCYPYCICMRSSNTHCQAALANAVTKACQRVSLPSPWWMKEKGVLKPRVKKTFYEDW
jgi:hypothetical protein